MRQRGGFTLNINDPKSKETLVREAVENADAESWAELLKVDEEYNDISVDEYEGEIDLTIFEDIFTDICKAVAVEFPEENFSGEAAYSSSSGYEEYHKISFVNGKLTVEKIAGEDCSLGYCPDCGNDVAQMNEYDENAEYECGMCGTTCSAEEAFSDGAPDVSVETLTLINGKFE